MKSHPVFQQKLGFNDPERVFQHLIATLTDTINDWSYFVNWSKVSENTKKASRLLNLMNSLVGHDNPAQELTDILTEYPDTAKLLPVLLAYRFKPAEKYRIKIIKEYKTKFEYDTYDFSAKGALPKADIERLVEFAERSGFLSQLANKNIKSLPDYFFGVEVGLDSNGRKNRGGTAMETMLEHFVADICARHGFEYIAQATAPKVKAKWGKMITVEKSSRKIDFAVNTPEKLYLIEANFYGGGGSKLKSTAGEYKTDFRRWTADGHQFIWVTDGAGWVGTQRPLQETFDDTDYILNLDMVVQGLLEGIITDLK